MSELQSPPARGSTADAVLSDLFDEITAKLQAGEPVDVDAYARDYPELAEPLRRLLPAVHVLADLGLSAARGEAAVAPNSSLEPWISSAACSAISALCARSAGAAWASCTRPSRSRWGAASP
jgi:hypothetical protein